MCDSNCFCHIHSIACFDHRKRDILHAKVNSNFYILKKKVHKIEVLTYIVYRLSFSRENAFVRNNYQLLLA